ncbi:MAG: hypothetical protein H6819_08320 [Phycisphaerales bacterium]|nr:hypothetical protein [Phycisphaerales bacterium]MCB9854190.1 hypothetical protein [Phycisphaerales bacterium]
MLDTSVPDPDCRCLTADFAVAGRPALSYDGRRVLFVGARSHDDPLNVWERIIDEENVRQVTRQPLDCLQAIYVAPRYSINDQAPEELICFAGVSAEGVRALFTCRLDGSHVRRITFGPSDASDPIQLSDSRLLYAGRRSPGHNAAHSELAVNGPATALFTIHIDGTDLRAFTGAGDAATRCHAPCETANDGVVFVESDIMHPSFGSVLAIVPRTHSMQPPRIMAVNAGSYKSPSPLSDDTLLVSYRSSPQQSFGVFVVDPSGVAPNEKLFDAPDWHDLDPVAIRPQRGPRGRSSVVKDPLDFGYLYCLDTYLSDDAEMRHVERGAAKYIRIIQALNGNREDSASASRQVRSQSAGDQIDERVLGEFPIEPDGSFHLQVPAETPLRLEMLDASRSKLHAMDSWFWVMPGEARGCIGCHEDRELTPPNRHVLALRRPPNIVTRGN